MSRSRCGQAGGCGPTKNKNSRRQSTGIVALSSPEVRKSPFSIGLYRWIWLAVLASNIGTWMQTVGAQWFLVVLPHATAMVALVQTADTLPDLLLALPGGALADIFDRRR